MISMRLLSVGVIAIVNAGLFTVPGLAEPLGDPPQLPLYSGPEQKLTRKEQRGLAYGKDWVQNRDGPARGADGAIVFMFGVTLPAIVCAPLYVCDLALEAGEAVNDLNVGDSVRWKITPASQGTGEAAITHVLIKPTDVGLLTNLVITTNKRTYTIKLVSREKDWMPRVAFAYPDTADALWSAYRARASDRRILAAAIEPRPPLDRAIVYAISGDNPVWRPVRVTSDGVKTYIEFSAATRHDALPVLLALAEDNSFLGLESLFNGPAPQLVNYRFVNNRFEVDKVLNRARLLSGVGGDRTQVTIRRER